MSNNFNNTDKIEDNSNEIFSRLQIPWRQSKEEVWDKLKNQLHTTKIVQINPAFTLWKIAAAALVIISLSISIFMHSYTINHISQINQFASYILPDGSRIELNANSQISYKPYWWWAKREMNLHGEAFFEVEKGKTFRVKSANGITEVLGTSFNVFTRGSNYEVICLTGRVKVQASITQNSVILHPSQKANLLKTGQFEVKENVNTENIKSWRLNRLIFTSMPLIEVFNEIEHQYGIEIILPQGLSQQYTGSFDKPKTAEELLHLVCRPFNLKVEKLGDNRFQISNLEK